MNQYEHISVLAIVITYSQAHASLSKIQLYRLGQTKAITSECPYSGS